VSLLGTDRGSIQNGLRQRLPRSFSYLVADGLNGTTHRSTRPNALESSCPARKSRVRRDVVMKRLTRRRIILISETRGSAIAWTNPVSDVASHEVRLRFGDRNGNSFFLLGRPISDAESTTLLGLYYRDGCTIFRVRPQK